MQIAKMNNRGQALMNLLVGLGIGLVVLGIVLMTGSVVTQEFDDATNTTSTNSLNTAIQGELGTSGLAGWIPAVVALSVGIIFISIFVGRRVFGGRSV